MTDPRSDQIGPECTAWRMVLIAILLGAFAVQVWSSLRWVKSFDTPNSSLENARSLLDRREYSANAGNRLYGKGVPPEKRLLRAFHLPGHPLFLAAGLFWFSDGTGICCPTGCFPGPVDLCPGVLTYFLW